MASIGAEVAFKIDWNIDGPHVELSERQFESWGINTPLGALSTRVKRDFESMMSVEDYDAGEILFLEQEPLTRVFVVITGDVRLSMQDIGGRRLTFQIVRHGAVLGMDSVLHGSLPKWSADMLHSSRIGVIGREQFFRLAERHPEVYRIALTEVIQTLQCAYGSLRIIGLNSHTRRRLALQLLEWGEFGSKNGGQTQFRMALTHEQIAEFIGGCRETVTRSLIAFKQLGLVEIRGSVMRIPSTKALRDYAERD
jgi:CRP/FNR family transcriptional regulator